METKAMSFFNVMISWTHSFHRSVIDMYVFGTTYKLSDNVTNATNIHDLKDGLIHNIFNQGNFHKIK